MSRGWRRLVSRTLYVAAGGGGDVLGTWMVAQTLEPGSVPAILSWSWDRLIVDPIPGPRSPEEFDGLEPLGRLNYRVVPTTTARWS